MGGGVGRGMLRKLLMDAEDGGKGVVDFKGRGILDWLLFNGRTSSVRSISGGSFSTLA